MTVQRGLGSILSGGKDFVTFEEGKPQTFLILDWYEDLVAIREHYEASLNPKYVKCPGQSVCPLCQANPDKYPSLRIKFRVFDPTDNKVKLVSMAKTHIKKLHAEFNLEEVDPTQEYVTIYRSGKGASDTSYSARRTKEQPPKPNFGELDMPDIESEVTPHTPEQIQGFMDALLNANTQQQNQQQPPQQQQPENQAFNGRKMPF